MNIIEKLGITPGPWMGGDDKRKKMRSTHGYLGNRYKDIFTMIAVYSTNTESEHSGDELEANQKLILAAPEMLEALIDSVEICEDFFDDGEPGMPLYEQKKIIEKATGKTWSEIKGIVNEE